MSKFIIEYNPMTGDTIPDGKVQKYVNDTIIMLEDTDQLKIIIGSVVIFDAFRVAICEKRLDYEIVTIRFNGKNYELDTEGKISNWPIGLCIVYDDILNRLVI